MPLPPLIGGPSATAAPLADTTGGARALDGGEVVGPETSLAWSEAVVAPCPSDAESPGESPGQRRVSIVVIPFGSTLIPTPGVSLGEKAVAVAVPGGTAAEACGLREEEGADPAEEGEQA